MSFSRRMFLGASAAAVGAWALLREDDVHTHKPPPPARLRGEVSSLEGGALTLRLRDGRSAALALTAATQVFLLERASFAEVGFGLYVGSLSRRLGEQAYSPISRHPPAWLYRADELRLVDEALRGIALGRTPWDLAPQSVMTHGWVDALEERVVSIRFGPAGEQATDVEVPRDAPVLRMTPGHPGLVRRGARVFAGTGRSAEGRALAEFVFVGSGGIAPPL